jgi:hypothetical protein
LPAWILSVINGANTLLITQMTPKP